MNVTVVSGHLSSAPRTHELATGAVVVRYEVTVPRDEGPADSVPVSWTGPPKRAAAMAALDAGAEVVVVGRVRRRWYRPVGGPSRSATEVVADTVVAASRKAAARRAIQGALAGLDGGQGR